MGAATPARLEPQAGLAHALSPSEEGLLGSCKGCGTCPAPRFLGTDPAEGLGLLPGAEWLTQGAATAQPRSLGLFAFHSDLCVTLETDTAEGEQCPLFPHPLVKGQLIFTQKEIRAIR